ncbi:uncharacterized protein LOC131950527 [Physella acuta]|uniref:uncharacterized protein LOC131950527 n=1 Tax=Physella acuta TaxID=109671 RepID=UPI0027DB0527|nr:uncharacterized protein LOC131950527 [Physella acuta]
MQTLAVVIVLVVCGVSVGVSTAQSTTTPRPTACSSYIDGCGLIYRSSPSTRRAVFEYYLCVKNTTQCSDADGHGLQQQTLDSVLTFSLCNDGGQYAGASRQTMSLLAVLVTLTLWLTNLNTSS